MIQFLGTVLFFVVAVGITLHMGAQLPGFLEWLGTLPGDIVVKKGGIIIFAPVTTSIIISIVFSFFFSFFSKR